MKVMADTPLKRIRLDLGVSQEGLARRTRSVSTGTVKNAENGKRVTYDTATQILESLAPRPNAHLPTRIGRTDHCRRLASAFPGPNSQSHLVAGGAGGVAALWLTA